VCIFCRHPFPQALELDSIKNAKMKDEKRIEQLTRGWKMEREQSELVLDPFWELVEPTCSLL